MMAKFSIVALLALSGFVSAVDDTITHPPPPDSTPAPCPASCMPDLCTGEATMSGTTTQLTYLCPAETDCGTIHETVTVFVTVTPTISVAAQGSAPSASGDDETTTITIKSTSTTYITKTIQSATSSGDVGSAGMSALASSTSGDAVATSMLVSSVTASSDNQTTTTYITSVQTVINTFISTVATPPYPNTTQSGTDAIGSVSTSGVFPSLSLSSANGTTSGVSLSSSLDGSSFAPTGYKSSSETDPAATSEGGYKFEALSFPTKVAALGRRDDSEDSVIEEVHSTVIIALDNKADRETTAAYPGAVTQAMGKNHAVNTARLSRVALLVSWVLAALMF